MERCWCVAVSDPDLCAAIDVWGLSYVSTRTAVFEVNCPVAEGRIVLRHQKTKGEPFIELITPADVYVPDVPDDVSRSLGDETTVVMHSEELTPSDLDAAFDLMRALY